MPEAGESLDLGLAHGRSNCGAEGEVAEQRTKAPRQSAASCALEWFIP